MPTRFILTFLGTKDEDEESCPYILLNFIQVEEVLVWGRLLFMPL